MTYVDVDDQATADLLQLIDRISNTSIRNAERLLEDYENVIAQLRDFPESGRASRRDPTKRLVIRGRYSFLYEYDPEIGVLLLRILDGRRLPELP